jgi:predicted ATPase
LEAAAAPFFQNTPFHAITELLRQLVEQASLSATKVGELFQAVGVTGWRASQTKATTAGDGAAQLETDERLAQLESALVLAGLKPAESIPLTAQLLNLPASVKYQPPSIPPEEQRRRLLAMLMGWLLGAGRSQPLVIVIEDLHWADASTLEVIQLLAEQGQTAPLLLLCTARPEFRQQWPLRAHHTQITLNRLSARNVREMIAEVAARNTLAGETVDAVIERTGGVPLFVEELTRAVLEGAASGTGREIPATLHDSLMARLDRLGPAKEVLQIGAVIGTEFSYGLLHAVHPLSDKELQAAIHRATDAELIFERGIAPNAIYQFKHTLIRDTAYGALLRSRRKELRSRIAEVLVRQFPDKARSAPELLAHHYSEAGLIEQALSYWQCAGKGAVERSANAEAISHFTKGLELLAALPDNPERSQQELMLQIALGKPLMAIKGYASPEAGKAYARALELCRQAGETPELFEALVGLLGFYITRGKLETTREMADQLLRLAQNLQSQELLQEAHFVMGLILGFLGELPESLKHLERAMALYDPQKRRVRTFDEPVVGCFAIAAGVLWELGYPDQALARIEKSLTLARELSHPYGLAYALISAIVVYCHRREGAAAQGQAEALIALSDKHGFALLKAFGITLRGWALAKQGRHQEGIAQIRNGLAAAQATEEELWQSWFFTLLAEVCWNTEQAEEGLTALTEAFHRASKIQERWSDPARYRLRGELLMMQAESDTAQAENCFQRAIEIARERSAKSWELRATTSLVRLLTRQGRRDEARTRLAEIYNWFTEGFDTADLKEAKALLDELSQ